ncbi:ketopantoate hydroxymethyltransferase [Paenibacillus sp. y28]|uniref:ketopantoate hydroxymethyltransferase n=1 Tax=Paenibacillus sp. y28 TaxID=3129110 RepID=UPI0030172F90
MITSTYLAELAGYTDQRIAKVLLNDSYEISDFSVKQQTGSTVDLEYLIPNGSVSEVTKIELRGASGDVISSSAVYVPITSDTIIRQILTVREAGGTG